MTTVFCSFNLIAKPKRFFGFPFGKRHHPNFIRTVEKKPRERFLIGTAIDTLRRQNRRTPGTCRSVIYRKGKSVKRER